MAWHPSGNVLATAGTDGCIHLWNVATAHEVLRITARDGGQQSGDACIWSLLVLPDGTVVRCVAPSECLGTGRGLQACLAGITERPPAMHF